MRKRVAILVQPSRAYGRGLLKGITTFCRAHRDWSIYHDERNLTEELPHWLHSWHGDGIITSLENDAIVDYIQKKKLPTVDIHGDIEVQGVPRVVINGRAAAEQAFSHLYGLGLRKFAFCGFKHVSYSEDRKDALIKKAAEHDLTVDVFLSPYSLSLHASNSEADGLAHQKALAEWVCQLSRPVGIVTCNDVRGMQILMAARDGGLKVPDEVAVVGIDNDRLICDLADPPLSSVELDTVQVGYRSAALLSKMMQGSQTNPKNIINEPGGVVVRQSSNILAIFDPEMAAVAEFIHENACSGINVEDVVTASLVSRSTLERRFSKAVGRSLKSEINRARINRIKDLLSATDYKLDAIARMTGFAHAQYMSALFKKNAGMSPGVYRREHQSKDLDD